MVFELFIIIFLNGLFDELIEISCISIFFVLMN